MCLEPTNPPKKNAGFGRWCLLPFLKGWFWGCRWNIFRDCTRNDHLDVSVLGNMYLYKELKIHTHEQRRVDVDMCKKDLLDPFRIMSNMDVSENRGTPKSSILIGLSIVNHQFWGTPIFGNTHMGDRNKQHWHIMAGTSFWRASLFFPGMFIFKADRSNELWKNTILGVDFFPVPNRAKIIPKIEIWKSEQNSSSQNVPCQTSVFWVMSQLVPKKPKDFMAFGFTKWQGVFLSKDSPFLDAGKIFLHGRKTKQNPWPGSLLPWFFSSPQWFEHVPLPEFERKNVTWLCTPLTSPKFNSSPLKIGQNPKGNSSSNHPFSGASC